MIIGGLRFRFIDTAGIRETVDIIEAKGVERTHEKIKQAKLIIYLVDPEQNVKEIETQISYLKELNIPFLIVVNKKDLVSAEFEGELSVVSYQLSDNIAHTSDLVPQIPDNRQQTTDNILYISARNKTGIEELKSEILRKINLHNINTDDVLISNIRHLEALQKTEESLNRVLVNIDNPITSDFLASDIKQALYYLGEITGQVTTDDLLETIFSKFCIGK
jgi:tRNA modification GTPase